MTEKYDAIVIGLGAMGAATLYQFAKRGRKVLGIDRYAPPHTLGSSHGDTRITRLACGEGAAYTPFARRSHEIWRDLEQCGGDPLLVPQPRLLEGSVRFFGVVYPPVSYTHLRAHET